MSATTIIGVSGHRRWDSRGRPVVEAVVRTVGGVGTAIAPAGASVGSGEAVERRDGGERLGGYDVRGAVEAIGRDIAPVVIGLDAASQATVDESLDALDGATRFASIGANAAVAVSMAAAHAAASSHRLPLWNWLDPDARMIPVPEIQIIGGGAHASGRIDLQDLMVVPFGAASFAEALEWAAEIYLAAGARLTAEGHRAGVADEGGWWPMFANNEGALHAVVAAIEAAGLTPGDQVGIALDVAATQFHDGTLYNLAADGRVVDSDGMCELLLEWVDRFPITSIEDPLAEEDVAGMAAFVAAVGERIQVVGDDYLVTDADRIRDAARQRTVNTALIKPNQAGTLTRARAALDAAHEAGFGTIMSARSGETEDVTIAHLAVGWRTPQLKVGSITRGERTAKWNEVLRIEEAMGDRARYPGGSILRRGQRAGDDRA